MVTRGQILRFCSVFLKRNKRSMFLFIGILLALTVTGHWLIFWEPMIPDNINVADTIPFEPEVVDDFPTVDNVTPRIPHIIHQTYKSTSIPAIFSDNVRSFIKHNPNWTYYIWTDESARRLIADKHPYLLRLWDNYNRPINRADALRYVVLYEYGGVYADMDFECLRPLDRVTIKYACVIPTEPFEHSVFRNGIPYFINNAIMLCRPRHPFMKQLIDNLALTRVMIEQIDVAGPAFVTYNFLVYNNITDIYQTTESSESNSPYFYKGRLREDDIDAVYVPNSVYFMNSLDQHDRSEAQYYRICSDFILLNTLYRRACLNLLKRGFHRENHKYTFTRHHWFQTYRRGSLGIFYDELRTLVPNYKLYGRS